MSAERLSSPVSPSCIARCRLADSARDRALRVRERRTKRSTRTIATSPPRTTPSTGPLRGMTVARIAGEIVSTMSVVRRLPRRCAGPPGGRRVSRATEGCEVDIATPAKKKM